MKFKRNITITFACFYSEFMICIIPMILIMELMLAPYNFGDAILVCITVLPAIIIASNLFFWLISLIANLFMKMTIELNYNSIIVNNKNSIVVINNDDVKYITYDLGNISKSFNSSSSLSLFDKDLKLLLYVSNPSIIMVHLIKKRCKYSKISYYNNKRFLWILGITISISILIPILVKILQ